MFGEIVGATLCGRPNNPDRMIEKWLLETENKFENVKIPIYVIMPNHIHFVIAIMGDHTGSETGDHTGSETGDHTGSPLQDIVGWFKTMTTNEYIRGVKQKKYQPFDRQIWQRGYYEHIIRNDREYQKIYEYIENNPAKWEEDKYYNSI